MGFPYGKKKAPSWRDIPEPNEKRKRRLFQSKRKPVETTVAVDHPFNITIEQLQDTVDPKNEALLEELGGVEGIVRELKTDGERGLDSNDDPPGAATKGDAERPMSPGGTTRKDDPFHLRKQVFGVNELPPAQTKSFLYLIYLVFQDKMLIILSVAAVVSLAVGLYQDFGPTRDEDEESENHWIDGVAILVVVMIVVLSSSINDWQKQRQFKKLNAKKEDRDVTVYRDGIQTFISIRDLVVGDILSVEPGDIIPADGIYISGHNCRCDESAATGESDAIKKGPASDGKDPFFISGGKVLEGVAKLVVIAVGKYSYSGKTVLSMRTESAKTPLQEKLNTLTEKIAKLGGAIGIIMLTTLLIMYVAQTATGAGFGEEEGQQGVTEIVQAVIGIVITTVAIIVVAVPEGLPMAVTLSLAFATIKMLKDNNLVRQLASCETMGHATSVCSDKTGTLTQNVMTVVAGKLADHVEFEGVDKLSSIAKDLPSDYFKLLNEAIAVNSTAFESIDDDGKKTLLGSKTETALLGFQRRMGSDFQIIREEADVTQLFPFSSDRKCMATLIDVTSQQDSGEASKGEGKKKYRLHVKGASEIILGFCDSISKVDSSATSGVRMEPKTDKVKEQLSATIESYAKQSLRTIGIAYRDFSESELKEYDISESPPLEKLTLLAIVGIEDPLRDGVAEAVKTCQKAGVFIRMVTGDNIVTARAIATKCNIFSTGGICMEGAKFRKLPPEDMKKVIPRLQVLARSSPTDKQLLVGQLQEMGEVVAVTGDGTNDGPALKMADVGFSMGISGTEVAKEASAIVLMDDNFTSIVKALAWGRAVNDAVKKFLQFQLTVNVAAVAVAFVTSVSDPEQKSVLTTIQLLWVNLIMDSFGALALASEPPSPQILQRLPESRKSPLITFSMWKMILGEAAFQIVVNLTMYFAGEELLGATVTDEQIRDFGNDRDKATSRMVSAIIFNTFVFLQLFNEINCRRLDSRLNVFYNMHKNPLFIAIIFIIALCQVLIVEFGGEIFKVHSLSAVQWVISLVLGFLSFPVGVVIRLIPDDVFFWQRGRNGHIENDRVAINKERLQWFHAMEKVQTQLKVFRALRGSARLREGGDQLSSATAIATIMGAAPVLGQPLETLARSQSQIESNQASKFKSLTQAAVAKQQQQNGNSGSTATNSPSP